MDYVIIARQPAATMDFHEVKQSLQHVLRIAKVMKKCNVCNQVVKLRLYS